MPLVTTTEMLIAARRGGYAVGAFTVDNMEMARAVLMAAEAEKAPVIVQTASSTLRYAPPLVFSGMVAALAANIEVPVALHLDHGESYELCVKAVEAGYTSVMIDGAHLPFEENVALTRKVVDMASPRIPVEAGLELVGGKEGGQFSEGWAGADPAEAAEFVKRTGVSSLAVAAGAARGCQGTSKPDFQRLDAIHKNTDVPLVLHDASGVSDADLQTCVRLGVCKVNFTAELRIAYTLGIRSFLSESPDACDPKLFGKAGMERVFALVTDKIRCLWSFGKAI